MGQLELFSNCFRKIKHVCRNTEKEFPPKRPWWKWVILSFNGIVGFAASVVTLNQYFFADASNYNIGMVYISLSVIIFLVIFDRYLRNNIIIHKERLEDPSEVLASINEARDIMPYYIETKDKDKDKDKDNKIAKPNEYKKLKKSIDNKAQELKELGEYGWTEYRKFSLDVLLVDFYNVEYLKAYAQSLLNELEDYSEDSSYRYDREYYGKWKERVDNANKSIDQAKNEVMRDKKASELRAEVRMLMSHVAEYKSYWTHGSMIIRGIMVGGAVSIPLFLVMGLAPALNPYGAENLEILNWGLLGVVGALTAVVLGLRKSDLVEVGNTEGKKELWRAILGGVLGLVAGILAYSFIVGGLISDGNIVPCVEAYSPDCKNPNTLRNVALATLWAVAAGFSFERVFERVRGVAEFSS